MRAIIVVCACLVFHSSTWAQDPTKEKLTISFQDMLAIEALAKLEKQTSWKFSYNPDAIPKQKITESFSEQPMGYILNHILGPDFEYKIRGSYLIIQHRYTKEEIKKSTIQISGEIKDAQTGKSLSNVSVYEVNDLTASLSGKDGKYQITAPTLERFTVLAISKENYQDTLIRISELNTAPIKVELKPKEPNETEKEESNMSGLVQNEKLKAHQRNVTLYEERVAQISFLPVAGSNGLLGGKIANKYSLNVVAGLSHSVKGVEIGGALNMEKMDVTGVQIAGASNIVGNRVKGVQIAGFSNTNFMQAEGVIIAGATNSSGAVEGVQIAGAYNYVKYKMKGWQVSGAINYAGELEGVQLGVLNIAKKAKKGVMIGIVNISQDGLLRFELEHNDLTRYNLAFKSGTYPFYSIFTSGITPRGANPLWSYGMGFGSQWFFKGKTYTVIEATSHTLQPLDRHISGLIMDNRLSISYGFQIFDHLSVDFGPVVHYLLFYNKKPHNQPFFEEMGFSPFASNQRQKAWIGYRIGVRF